MPSNLKNIDDVMRKLKKLGERVSEVLTLHRTTQTNMVTANMHLEINYSDPHGRKSPDIKDGDSSKINDKNVKLLRQKYAVVQELFHTKTELEAMESILKVNFKNTTPDKALREIEKLKRDVLAGISEAFAFLQKLSEDHMPRKLALLSKGVMQAVEKSLLYQKGRIYNYVFEVNGELCFAYYIHLNHLEDEDGKVFPEIFLTMTMRMGAEPTTFVGLQHHFTPPSEDLLMKRVKSIKEALHAYATLLELDSFDNTLGSLPLDAVLNPKSIVKNLFSYAGFVNSLDVDEHAITFNLKKAAIDKISEIASQLLKEMGALQRSTNARLRMSVDRGKSPRIYFKFVRQKDGPLVKADDLDFLKMRFGVSDDALGKIAKVINLG